MKIAILTDNDLDGAGSALLIKQLFKHKAEEIFIKEITDFQMKNEVPGWLQVNLSKYDKVFITDMFVPDEVVPLVDNNKVVIIDHHQSHVDVKDRFTKCKALIETDTSCVKLIRKIFKDQLTLNPQQERLCDIIDDYDNYTLKLPETLKLNAVFHSYNKPKVEKFLSRFEDGIKEFNTMELNAAKLSLNKLKDLIDTCEYYVGELKGCKVVSCFATHSINEIAHYCIKKFDSDISIVCNLNTKSVSFRKNKERCTVKLNKLAEALCDGGGHEYAAGGKITDRFLAFAKTLNKIQ